MSPRGYRGSNQQGTSDKAKKRQQRKVLELNRTFTPVPRGHQLRLPQLKGEYLEQVRQHLLSIHS